MFALKNIKYYYFKSVKKIKNATLEELMAVKTIDKSSAKNIFTYFKDNE
ncbi:MAG: helix-hairpin-helix domain-containing protein [Bacteroides sp.]